MHWGRTLRHPAAIPKSLTLLAGAQGYRNALTEQLVWGNIEFDTPFGKIRLKYIIRPNFELMENDTMILCEGLSGCKKLQEVPPKPRARPQGAALHLPPQVLRAG
eukprot:scaffold6612_cov114-Isochrysis_galbana.AAC.3